MVADS